MRAVKLWSSVSAEERKKSGNPPPEWVKESIYFSDNQSVPYFESLSYQVMTDDEFTAYLAQHQSSFDAYLQTGYQEVASFNVLFQENEEKIRKGKEFLLLFKLRNLAEGINWPQAVWLHHRIKNWNVNIINLGAFEVDIYNVINSGDLESAIYMLQSGEADDMSKPYHWVTPARIQWCVQELTKLLQSP